MSNTVGAKVKAAREQFGYGRSEFARMAGISRSTLIRIEDETFEPTMDTLEKIADVYSVSVSQFLTDMDDGDRPFTEYSSPATKADVAKLEAKLDAITRLLEEKMDEVLRRLPPRGPDRGDGNG